MKQSTVFECSVCEKISKDSKVIRRCEAKHKKQDEEIAKQKALAESKQKRIQEVLNSSSIDELIVRATEYVNNLNVGILSQLTLTVSYRKDARNSHSSPIGTKTVFSSSNNPENYKDSYDAFYGRVSGNFKEKILKPYQWIRISDILKEIGIHTGSGGGGERFSYDLTIWIDDFPNIKKQIEENEIAVVEINRLTDEMAFKQSEQLVSNNIVATLRGVVKEHLDTIDQINGKINAAKEAIESINSDIYKPLKEEYDALIAEHISKCKWIFPNRRF